jgi:enolase
MNIDDFPIKVPTASWAKSVLLIYLAEIERLNTSESRSFYVTINGEDRSETINLVRNYSALELTFVSDETSEFTFDLVKAPDCTSRPIINAFEYYTIHDTDTATSSHDIEALDAIKSKYDIKGWISDPCYYMPWNGLGCVNTPLGNRISEINLSGRNLRGLVPEEIGQLTALVTV